jgi:hypothetical protein
MQAELSAEMVMNIRQLFSLGAMFVVMTVSAQEACPGGTQVGQNCGGGYCVPICAYDESPQPAPPPRVVERWEVFDNRFGSFALAPNGPYGVASNQPSADAAEQAALLHCQQRGGVGCESWGFHMNSCATYAWGGGNASVAGGPTQEQSERHALERCARASGQTCDVIETTCSTPVSRWVDEKPPGWEPAER